MCLVYENVQTRRTYILQLRGWDQRESSASLLQPYHHNNVYVHMYVMMNSHTKSGIYIKIFCVNSQWYERASETFAGLPVGRLERSFYTDSTYDVCMYVVAVDNESKLFYCMMTLTA